MMRKLVPLLAAVILILALIPPTWSAGELTGEEARSGQIRGVGQWLYSLLRPQPKLDASAVDGSDLGGRAGVNTFLQEEVLPEVREESLSRASDIGFSFVRQQFPWEDIEVHGQGDFVDRRNVSEGVDSWAKYDQIVSAAEESGIEIIARLDNPPAWTRAMTDTIGTHGPPDDFTVYGDYVAAVAERYAGKITYFQLWNEPNIYPEWGERAVDPEGFVELLCVGYRRLKQANPEAVALVGALAPTLELGGRNMNDLAFLQRMYRAGAADCFDIMSVQGYGLWSGPTDQRLRPTAINYPHHLYIRDLMVANGDEHKPIWISETAWNAVPESMAAPFGRVTEQIQAEYAVQAYQVAAEEWPWIEVINYWFLKRASDNEIDQPFYYFRLFEPDFEPLPAVESLTTYFADGGDEIGSYERSFRATDSLRGTPALLSVATLLFCGLLWLVPPERKESDS